MKVNLNLWLWVGKLKENKSRLFWEMMVCQGGGGGIIENVLIKRVRWPHMEGYASYQATGSFIIRISHKSVPYIIWQNSTLLNVLFSIDKSSSTVHDTCVLGTGMFLLKLEWWNYQMCGKFCIKTSILDSTTYRIVFVGIVTLWSIVVWMLHL